MFSIKDLLIRYQHITLPDEVVRREAQSIIKELTNIDLDIKHLKIVRGELVVEAPAVVRSVIYIKQHKITQALNERLGKKAPKKVR